MRRLNFLRILPGLLALPSVCEALGAGDVIRSSRYGVPDDGEWHRFDVSYDRGYLCAWRDGVPIPVEESPIRLDTQCGFLEIGGGVSLEEVLTTEISGVEWEGHEVVSASVIMKVPRKSVSSMNWEMMVKP